MAVKWNDDCSQQQQGHLQIVGGNTAVFFCSNAHAWYKLFCVPTVFGKFASSFAFYLLALYVCMALSMHMIGTSYPPFTFLLLLVDFRRVLQTRALCLFQ